MRLSCAQTPLAWPAAVALSDLPVCTGCAIRLDSPQPGSLQVTTRRAGDGVGDGVNVDENRGSVAVDYRGQRYTLIEAIFHTPGQHIFPGQSDVYPAEYCLHFQTFAAPQRKLTLVVPVSHQVSGPGVDYFAAIKAQPDPAATRPTLLSLFGSPTIDTVQFLAPDLRGRTSESPIPAESDTCAPTSMESMMALVLQPCQIRATDLERIPREGSLSTDPRDLPAQPRLKPTEAVSRAALLAVAVLARPGLQTGSGPTVRTGTGTGIGTGNPELECYPLEVRGGKDVIAVDGSGIPIETVLGVAGSCAPDVSGGLGMIGTLRKALFGDAPANASDSDSVATGIAFSVFFLSAFFLNAALWLILRVLLFKESAEPNLNQFSVLGWFIILLAGTVGVVVSLTIQMTS
jgi:hypothetical protein